MSDQVFKAGDFNKGKMNEIFKTANGKECAIISHKQFGEFYLISKSEFDLGVYDAWSKCDGVIEYLQEKGVLLSVLQRDINIGNDKELQRLINSFYGIGFNSLLGVQSFLNGVIKMEYANELLKKGFTEADIANLTC